jgi:hypothetical protein
MINKNCKHNYEYDPQQLYAFDKYMSDLSGISIYYGLGEHSTTGDSNFKVKFIVEHPNLLYTIIPHMDININHEIDKYDLIFNICPYTCNMLNDKYKTDKCVYTFFPLPEVNLQIKDRIYDIFYSGHYDSNIECLPMIYKIINKYMGNTFTSLLKDISIKHSDSFIKKMDIYSQTKICILHNILSNKYRCPGYSNYITDIYCVKHLPWHTSEYNAVPQQKSRMFEGAMAGCILLVYKDKYNIIENYFKENDEFIYFENEEDLDAKVHMILDNYEHYKQIGLNAQKKYYNNYTFKHFIDNIIYEYNRRKS